MAKPVWQERFSEGLDPRVHQLNRSIGFDVRLYPYDIAGSKAWAWSLYEAKALPREDLDAILEGLERVSTGGRLLAAGASAAGCRLLGNP